MLRKLIAKILFMAIELNILIVIWLFLLVVSIWRLWVLIVLVLKVWLVLIELTLLYYRQITKFVIFIVILKIWILYWKKLVWLPRIIWEKTINKRSWWNLFKISDINWWILYFILKMFLIILIDRCKLLIFLEILLFYLLLNLRPKIWLISLYIILVLECLISFLKSRI